jgi:hypothetical protein
MDRQDGGVGWRALLLVPSSFPLLFMPFCGHKGRPSPDGFMLGTLHPVQISQDAELSLDITRT